MASDLQKRANRANALKSTGPTSEAGKLAVRLNATRHGLLSQAPVMAGESEEEYNALRAQLESELVPVGIVEGQLCERIAGALWRLRRLSHIEAGLLTGGAAKSFADAAEEVAKTYTRTEGGHDALVDVLLEEAQGRTVVENEQAHADAKGAATEARAVLWSVPALLGAAYRNEVAGADALTKLSRYGTTLEKSLFRSLQELRHLQAMRRRSDEKQQRRRGVS